VSSATRCRGGAAGSATRYATAMAPSHPLVTLRAGPAEAVLDPGAGGRIAALRVDGVDLLVTRGDGPLTWGAYPMVPWAGRLRDGMLRWDGSALALPTDLLPPHAIHGTLIDAAWEIGAPAGDAAAILEAPLGDAWPFGGRAVHRVSLTDETLTATLEVHADGRPFPAIAGWHPWFPRTLQGPGAAMGDPVEVEVRARGMLRRGDDYLPTGEVVPVPAGPLDDCLVGVTSAPVVRWPGAFEITIESDAAYWVVYTQHADGVCVEPQTGPPNGLNTGDFTLVEPGRPLIASMTLRWRRLG
jgi:aldose 1-epimerase